MSRNNRLELRLKLGHIADVSQLHTSSREIRMLNHADSIDRKIEKLPISVVNRNLAQANNAAAEASIDRIARALTWIRSFFAVMPRREASD